VRQGSMLASPSFKTVLNKIQALSTKWCGWHSGFNVKKQIDISGTWSLSYDQDLKGYGQNREASLRNTCHLVD
jgi:hypothetical protein